MRLHTQIITPDRRALLNSPQDHLIHVAYSVYTPRLVAF